jgi:REP element-mobilizing transposase RayT
MTNDLPNPNRHRRSTRLQSWDYAQSAPYFVTICTEDRLCVFGEIVEDASHLNRYGQIAEACWQAIPAHFPHVELDAFVVMPNHVHGILLIVSDAPTNDVTVNDSRGAAMLRPYDDVRKPHQIGVQPRSLSAIVRSYKSAVAKQINQLRNTPGATLWQRNYYDRIIRNQRELEAKRQYVEDNPMQWALDEENPDVRPKRAPLT